jgi:hypothetical protein
LRRRTGRLLEDVVGLVVLLVVGLDVFLVVRVVLRQGGRQHGL